MKIRISNKLELRDLPGLFFHAICKKLTLPNPRWHENNRMGRYNGGTPRLLRFYEKAKSGGLIVPRGYGHHLVALCQQHDEPYQFDDQRRVLPAVEFKFIGQLRDYQTKAVKDMLSRDFGTLSAATGSGKTVMAAKLIKDRKQPALVIVHTKELLNQWVERIATFLAMPSDEIGIIGDGKKNVGQKITVALVQSLYKCADEISPRIGHVIIDECHRTPSRTFTEALTAFDCKYTLGLSATPYRRDKLSRLIFWYVGDVLHEVDKTYLLETGQVLQPNVITRRTSFKPHHDPSAEYSKMLSELVKDPERNRLICSDVFQEASSEKGIALVISDRKNHCEALRGLLSRDFNVKANVLTGSTPVKERKDIVEKLNKEQIKVLVATGQLIGEGFDCKDLSSLFLTTPIKFSGRVLQYVGRVLRPAPEKEQPRVYDYIDGNVGPLKAAAKARQRVYAGC